MPDPDKITLVVQDTHIGMGQEGLDRATELHRQLLAYCASDIGHSEPMIVVAPMGDMCYMDLECRALAHQMEFFPDALITRVINGAELREAVEYKLMHEVMAFDRPLKRERKRDWEQRGKKHRGPR